MDLQNRSPVYRFYARCEVSPGIFSNEYLLGFPKLDDTCVNLDECAFVDKHFVRAEPERYASTTCPALLEVVLMSVDQPQAVFSYMDQGEHGIRHRTAPTRQLVAEVAPGKYETLENLLQKYDVIRQETDFSPFPRT